MLNFITHLERPVIGVLYIGNISKDNQYSDHTKFDEYKHVMKKALNFNIEVKVSCIQDRDTKEVPANFIELIQKIEECYNLNPLNAFVFISNNFNRMHNKKDVAKKMKNWLCNYFDETSRPEFLSRIYFLEVNGEATTVYDFCSFENKFFEYEK